MKFLKEKNIKELKIKKNVHAKFIHFELLKELTNCPCYPKGINSLKNKKCCSIFTILLGLLKKTDKVNY